MDVAGSYQKSIQVHDTTLCNIPDASLSRKVLLLDVVWETKSKCTGGKGTYSWKYCTQE